MKALYTSLKAHEIHHLRNLLESAGIRCRIENEALSSLAGEVPFVDCAMRIVLDDEADRTAALAVVREMTSRRQDIRPAWTCPRCGESSESQFTACWQCGAERR